MPSSDPGSNRREINRRARQAALENVLPGDAEPTSLVSYVSHGRLLVIGGETEGMAAIERLAGDLEPWLWMPGKGSPVRRDRDGLRRVEGGVPGVTGNLGQFVLTVGDGGIAAGPDRLLGERGGRFDLVLDLRDEPSLTAPVLPVGYYAPRGDEAALDKALSDLPDMTGEFEKPKFFNYDASICAHGRSGIGGCTRCIDACPTQAIVSAGEEVMVNPYLCQGGGSCVAACPTGAMTYAFPKVTDLMAHVRRVLDAYLEAGGEAPVLMFIDEHSAGLVEARLDAGLPAEIIPVQVEEIGSLGLDAWLACLAYGACGVVLASCAATPAPVIETLDAQLEVAGALLAGMGYPVNALQRWTADAAEALELPDGPLLSKAARFTVPDEKRTALRLAINHLHAEAPAPRKVVGLPAHAPFGEVRVDGKACTLCMSCVGQCPTAALSDGAGLPQLNFTEWNCVQCGICARACPEDAIELSARFVYDSDARQTRRVLHEEQPFFCVSCGKPFATQSVLDVMKRKLESHWMFQTEEARRRLEMCDTCRVKDMARAEFAKSRDGH
jgi:ferredoxin